VDWGKIRKPTAKVDFPKIYGGFAGNIILEIGMGDSVNQHFALRRKGVIWRC
jgi:hypothetical protein